MRPCAKFAFWMKSGIFTIEPTFAGKHNGIHYEIFGSGKRRIVFVMGFLASMGNWNEFIQLYVDQGFSCLAFDNRGFGFSGATRLERYTTSGMAMDIKLLLDHLNWTNINLVGASMGGMISMELAALIPRRINALVLINTARQPRNPAGIYGLITRWGQVLYPKSSTAKEFEVLFDYIFSDNDWLNAPANGFTSNRERLISVFSRRKSINPPATIYGLLGQICACLTHCTTMDKFKIISSHVNKILILYGENDKVIDPNCSREMAQLLPYARLVEIKRKGHALPNEAQDELVLHMNKLFKSKNQSKTKKKKS